MADFKYITETGVIVPDTASIREDVENAWRAAFGDDLILDPSSPQGVIATLQVEQRDAVARNNAELANQINPDLSTGVFLDSIWGLTGGGRRPATRSTVAGVVLAGVPQTIIPAGSQAVAENSGAVFRTVAPAILGPDGTTTVDMEAVEFGPIQAGVDALNRVGSNVLGWETVTNPNAATPGRNQESNIASRTRRRRTLALNTISIPEAIVSALYNLDTVRSLSFRENISETAQTIDGIPMKPKSIYVCVEGGTDQEIAAVLVREKTTGGGYNGSVLVTYKEPTSKQEYPVQFDRPTEVSLFARFTIAQGPLDGPTLIPMIVQRWINGEVEGGVGLEVGQPASPFELAGVVNQQEPRFFVRKVELSTDGGASWTTEQIPIGLNQVARLPPSAVTVVTT